MQLHRGPKIYVVAMTRMRRTRDPEHQGIPALSDYLEEIGAPSWTTDASSDGDMLTEIGGRLCYRSWAPGLNANVQKVREGNAPYLRNVLSQRHGSVFEHASLSVIFHEVTRVFTHELVTHRVGIAKSQESLRYVRLTDLGFFLSPELTEGYEEVQGKIEAHLRDTEELMAYLADRYGLDDRSRLPKDPKQAFDYKKRKTSAMRRLAPIGLTTGVLWTSNVRTLRHVIPLRTSLGAEEEIRMVFDILAKYAVELFPSSFQDFTRNDDGSWTTPNEKI